MSCLLTRAGCPTLITKTITYYEELHASSCFCYTASYDGV